ncbi:MAG: acetamidase/formamidase family protein, partial [Allobranchiibius sp.]
METYGVTHSPIFMPSQVEPVYSQWLTFTGISVDHRDDTNLYMDATEAYRNACLNAIAYMKKWGYTGEQAYLILGTSPIQGRLSSVVDIPNACCSLFLPTEIFDFDIRPGGDGPVKQDRGQVAVTS